MSKVKNKNNNNLYLINGILFVLVLILGIYIVCDKLLSNNQSNTNINREIYSFNSNDIESEFKIYQINNLFIAVSTEKTKQCWLDNVIIYNSNGDTIKKFEHAEVTIDNNNNIKLRTSDNGQCMGENYESHITNYVIQGSKLIKQ